MDVRRRRQGNEPDALADDYVEDYECLGLDPEEIEELRKRRGEVRSPEKVVLTASDYKRMARTEVDLRSGCLTDVLQEFEPARLPLAPPDLLDADRDRIEQEIAQREKECSDALDRVAAIEQILPRSIQKNLKARELYYLFRADSFRMRKTENSSLEEYFVQEHIHRNPSRPSHLLKRAIAAHDYGYERLETGNPDLRLMWSINDIMIDGDLPVEGQGEDDSLEDTLCRRAIHDVRQYSQIGDFRAPRGIRAHESLVGLDAYLKSSEDSPFTEFALVLFYLEAIRPFEGYNEVTARIFARLHLMRQTENLSLAWASIFEILCLRHDEYYEAMEKVFREENYHAWILLVVKCMSESARRTIDNVRSLLQLEADCRRKVYSRKGSSALLIRLCEALFITPVMTTRDIEKTVGISFRAACSLSRTMEKLGMLEEITGQKREKKYLFRPLIDHLSLPDDAASVVEFKGT